MPLKILLNCCAGREVNPVARNKRQVMSEAYAVELVFINEFWKFVWVGRRVVGEQEVREAMGGFWEA